MRGRDYSGQVLTECICEFGGGVVLLFLAISGKYLAYVAPRICPFLIVGAAILFCMGIFSIPQIKHFQHHIHMAHCLLLVIPILLLVLPHSTAAQTAAAPSAGLATTVAKSMPSAAAVPQEEKTKISGLDSAHKRITVKNEEFYSWISELTGNLDKYTGYTVVMTGYVYKDPQFVSSGEFVPARLLMTCCTADLSPIGLLCKYAKAASLPEKSWVTVEGTLIKGSFQGSPDPQLQVTKVTKAQPVNDYVYPY